MKDRTCEFIKYPLLQCSKSTFFEKLMMKFHFGFAKCTVCGSFVMIIDTLAKKEKEWLRETCKCTKCGSTNRQRQVAFIICQSLNLKHHKRFSSIKQMSKLENCHVYNTEANGALHFYLAKMKNYICSEYFGQTVKGGEFVKGIMHQDLMSLSLAHESVDLVVSLDVFEHIPDPYKAHKEIYRILKKGGSHIFTVPFLSDMYLDIDFAKIDNLGNTVYLTEPVYHGDPIRSEGALVYKIFSLEMMVELSKIGFKTNLYQLYKPFNGIIGSNAIVFEAIKE